MFPNLETKTAPQMSWEQRLLKNSGGNKTKGALKPEYQELKFTLHRKLVDKINLEALAAIARQQDDPERAAWLLAAAGAQLQASGSGWLHAYVPRAPHDHNVEAQLRSQMGDAAYEQAAAHGRSLTGARGIQQGLADAQRDPQQQESPA